jgi:Bacterial antitoxin of type II TA system, VapB
LSFYAITNNFRKNPVSGFTHPTRRNRVFSHVFGCHPVFRKNPVSGPYVTTIIKDTVKRGKPMVTSLNVDTALLQEAIELEREVSLETLVEIALREYIQRRKQPQHLELSFGESLGAFREKYQLSELGLNPDEIWGEIRDRTFAGREVIFE